MRCQCYLNGNACAVERWSDASWIERLGEAANSLETTELVVGKTMLKVAVIKYWEAAADKD